MQAAQNSGIVADRKTEAAAVPYPSWTEIVDRLRREAPEQVAVPAASGPRDWHSLVADMIVGR